MPIDPSIALGVKPVQIESPVNALAQMLQVQGAQQQNQLGQAKLDEYQRSVGRQNRLLGLVQSLPSGTTDDQRISTLRNAGYFDEADKLETGFLNRQKIGADASKANAGARKDEQDTHMKQAEAVGQALGAMRGMPGVTPQYVASTIQHLGDIGVIPKEHVASSLAQIPRDPAQLSAWLAQKQQETMSTLDQLKYTTPDANTVATNAVSRANNAATNATTQRGQNMTDARAKEQLENSRGQVVQSDNGPVLVNTRTGTGKAVMGPDGQPLAGVTKPLNDSQSKALLFGTRMQESDKILKQLHSEGATTSVPGAGLPLIGGVINTFSNGRQQMLEQAKRDFMTAVLRRESGASISPGEFDTADKQYFPQVGEGANVIAQKARNRELAIAGVLNEVPEKQRGAITPGSGARTGGPGAPAGSPALPPRNAKGWALHVDAGGNRAYVSPDGKQYEEVH